MRHASITVNRQHYNGLLVEAEKRSNIQKMNNIADSVKYTVNHSLESAENVMQKRYMNRDINAFYKQKYDSTLDYYNNYIEFMKNFAGSDKYSITLYVDNESIVNGGYCKKIETIQNQSWYQQVAKGKEIICYSDYSKINWETKRQIYFVRKLDYYGKSSGNNFLKVDMNYSELQRTVMNLMHSNIVYVCAGDKIILSNEGKGGLYDPFETIKEEQIKKAGAHKILNVYESEWDIYVMPEKTQTFEVIREHGLLLLNVNDAFKQQGLDLKGCNYVPLGLTTNAGDENRWHTYGDTVNQASGIVVTKDCKDPDKAFDFLVKMAMDQELHDLRFWGVKDVDYNVDEDGLYYRTDEQRMKWADKTYQAAHRCMYSYFPQWNGTSDDGINANKPEDFISEMQTILDTYK